MSRILGQDRLLLSISRLIESSNFPRFSIIVGNRGSGKYEISKFIANKLGARFVVIEPKIDSVRECIKLAYEQIEPTLYFIPRTDKMSTGAKNALLKVTEEPPQKSYFIMGSYDRQNTLSTLLSRGTVFEIEDYSQQILQQYYLEDLKGTDKHIESIIPYCKTIGEVKTLVSENVNTKELKSLCVKVVNSIAQASGSNALKITQNLRYKTYEEEPDKFDIIIFMNGVTYELFQKVINNKIELFDKLLYCKAIVITSKYKQQLSITGINRLATMDRWILDLRKVLMEVNQYGVTTTKK